MSSSSVTGAQSSSHVDEDPKEDFNCLQCSANIIGIALFVIACVTAAGHMSGVAAGGCFIGLSAPLVILSIIQACKEKNGCIKAMHGVSVIASIALMIIGALALSGVIPSTTAGWAYLGIALGQVGLGVLACCCIGAYTVCKIKRALAQQDVAQNAPLPE